MVHVFLYIIGAQEDLAEGIKFALRKKFNRSTDKFYDIYLSQMDKIKLIENSRFRLIRRIPTFRKMFREMEKKISSIIALVNPVEPIFVYFSDEAVWGVVLRLINKKMGYRFTSINIQHGIFYLKDPQFIRFRQIANKISTWSLNYPIVGLGFGGAKSNYYLVYGSQEKEYLNNRLLQSHVIIAPRVIKYYAIKHHLGHQGTQFYPSNRGILFAMQNLELRRDCKLTEREIYVLLKPSFEHIKSLGYSIYFRMHPGNSHKEKSLKWLRESGLSDIVVDANDTSVQHLMSKVQMIMSFYSTMFFDGYLLGKIPIVIEGIVETGKLTFPHETLNINNNWHVEFDNIIKKFGLVSTSNMEELFDQEVIDISKIYY